MVEAIEKIGTPKDVWVTCPNCGNLFYIDRAFYSQEFNEVLLHCPFCHLEFDKKDSPKTWGI